MQTGILDGYAPAEIRRAQGWCARRLAHLVGLLRTTFYEAFTGQTRRETPRNGVTDPRELAELARLYALGMTGHQIAQRLGHPSSWAYRHINRMKQAAAQADDPVPVSA